MDMTDKELLEQVFQPMREMQIPDEGFTERVVQQMPDSRSRRLSRLWTILCVVVAVLLFWLLRGWEMIAYGLVTLLNQSPSPQQLALLIASVFIAGLIIVVEITDCELKSCSRSR